VANDDLFLNDKIKVGELRSAFERIILVAIESLAVEKKLPRSA